MVAEMRGGYISTDINIIIIFYKINYTLIKDNFIFINTYN